jgi:hypothetical protein
MAARSNREEKSDYHRGAGDLPGRVERKAAGGIEEVRGEGMAEMNKRQRKKRFKRTYKDRFPDNKFFATFYKAIFCTKIPKGEF